MPANLLLTGHDPNRSLPALHPQQSRFAFQSTGVSGQGAVAAQNAVTGDDDRDGIRATGVTRVALPLTGLKERVAALRRAVLLALVLAFLITAALSALFARPLAGPLAEIMTAARQFAAGNLAARIRVQRHHVRVVLGALLLIDAAHSFAQSRDADALRLGEVDECDFRG